MQSIDDIKQFLDAQFDKLNLQRKTAFNCSEGIDRQVKDSLKERQSNSTHFPIFYVVYSDKFHWEIKKFSVPYAGVV